MTLPQNLADMTGREVFTKVSKDAVLNILWYGGAGAIIFLVGKFIWWWLSVILFVGFAVVMIASTIQMFVITILSVIVIPVAIFRKVTEKHVNAGEEFWLGAGNVVQLIEIAILSGYVWVLAKAFFWA